MIEPGQLRRWHEGTYNVQGFNGIFIVLDRLKGDDVTLAGGDPSMPTWNIISGGIADWVYEVDIVEMSDAIDETR